MRTMARVVCILAVACAARAHAAEGGCGTVVAISGEVLATPPGTFLRIGDTVQEGTVVETGPGAAVKLVFDRALLSIGGGTRMELSRYYFADEKGVLETLIRLVRGIIRTQIGPGLGPESSFQIATWNTIAGVKGTDFSVEAEEGTFSACYVFEGEVELVCSSGDRRILSAGEMGRVEGAGGAITAKPISPGLQAQKQVTLREAPRSGALSGGARAKALAASAAPGSLAAPPAGIAQNPQVNVVGNQPINPKNLSVPAVPGQAPPVPRPPAPLGPPGPSVPPERPEGLPF